MSTILALTAIYGGLGIVTVAVQQLEVFVVILSAKASRDDVVGFQLVFNGEVLPAPFAFAFLVFQQLGFSV
jgi:hypothetical protein